MIELYKNEIIEEAQEKIKEEKIKKVFIYIKKYNYFKRQNY